MHSFFHRTKELIFRKTIHKLLYKDQVDNDQPKHLLIISESIEFNTLIEKYLSNKVIITHSTRLDKSKQIISKLLPDIILLEETDRYNELSEFYQSIKSNNSIKEIPFLILSDKKPSLETHPSHAEIISYPYKINQLISKINNCITHSPVSTQSLINSKTPYDNHKFVQNVFQIIENEYSNPNFNVNSLCKMLYVSRTYLYNHFTINPNTSPAQFIKEYRIVLAYTLLCKQNLNVSEVAFKVGYVNTRYFTLHFKEQFGITPSSLLQTKHKNLLN